MPNRLVQHIPILLLFSWLTSGSGCAVLNIPSYRADSCAPVGSTNVHGASIIDPTPGSDGMLANHCPPGFLPPIPLWLNCGIPVPSWWAEWKAHKDLPEPAPYPRFQPLPTRPMFSPREQDAPMPAVSSQGEPMWQAGMAPQSTPPAYGQLP